MGSSPRVRGKRVGVGDAGAAVGLIPARAGKTAGGGSRGSSHPAHPRACGENYLHCGHRSGAGGSSPRVRGKPVGTVCPRASRRLIPARAGKTGPGRGRASATGAHPRACGENHRRTSENPQRFGSSPRVRGKQHAAPGRNIHNGLIPARAGKTRFRASNISGCTAHPRACGENRGVRGSRALGRGSSPRVRGKRVPGGPHCLDHGLIPARAGKTTPPPPRRSGRPAHPRACGENVAARSAPRPMRGSSPRVRGKPSSQPPGRSGGRLIPARAGKTRPVAARRPAR